MAVIYKAELKLEPAPDGYDRWHNGGYTEAMWADKKHSNLKICDGFIKDHFLVKDNCSEIDAELHDKKVADGLPVSLGDWYRDDEVLCGEAFDDDYILETEVAVLLRKLMHEKRNLHHVWLRILA